MNGLGELRESFCCLSLRIKLCEWDVIEHLDILIEIAMLEAHLFHQLSHRLRQSRSEGHFDIPSVKFASRVSCDSISTRHIMRPGMLCITGARSRLRSSLNFERT